VRSMKTTMVFLIVSAVMMPLATILGGCSFETGISYDPSSENAIIRIKEVKGDNTVFELYGNGVIRVRRDIFESKVESGQLSQRQVKQILNHVINKLRIGELQSSYPKEFIPGIEMYPNMELILEVNIDGFNKHISFAYSNVCDELEYFLEEGRIDRQAFKQLNRLKAVFDYLLEYKF